MALNTRNKQVLDDFLITGNGTESYLKFYKSVKKKETAAAAFSRLYNSKEAKEYLEVQMEKLNDRAIAKADEVLRYLTSVMRGHETEQVLIGFGEGVQRITNIEVSAKDRIKAAELIGKRYGTWTDKVDMNVTVPEIVFDVPLEDDD